MNRNKPLVSVIIPVFNREKYIEESMNSVLSQTYSPIEIIVVDDGSTDRTPEIVKKYKSQVKYFYQKNAGTSAARNKGVRLSKGNYLAFLDSDDVWTKNKIELQMKTLKEERSINMVFGYAQQFISPELSDEERKRINYKQEPLKGIIPSCILITKDNFLRVGFFNENSEFGEFLDWYLRANELKLKEKTIPEIVLKRRIHTENMGITHRDLRFKYARYLKESLERKRTANN